MRKEEYKGSFEQLADDTDVSISPRVLAKFVNLALELQDDAFLTLDEISEEFTVLIPEGEEDNDTWVSFVEEVSNCVFEEKESINEDEYEESEEE